MDEEARRTFDVLVEVRATSLLRTAYLLTGDWGTAEDLLQTALVKTWFAWDGLRDAGAAEAYVRRVMARTYATWWRRKWRGELATGELPDVPARDAYADVDQRHALRRALSELTPRQRAIVVLRFYEDLTEAQVADLLGCSLGTVKSTASRALVRLRGLVGDASVVPVQRGGARRTELPA